jgi:ankyrin repeat protein
MPANNKKTKNGKKKRQAGTGGSRSAEDATEALVNACIGQGNTTFEIVQGCIADGANVNATAHGKTPLGECFLQADSAFEIVKVLLDAGANIDFAGTELLLVVSRNGIKCVELILQAGTDINARNVDEETFLHVAAKFNVDDTITDLLLKAGHNADAKDIHSRTPLHLATIKGFNTCVGTQLIESWR